MPHAGARCRIVCKHSTPLRRKRNQDENSADSARPQKSAAARRPEEFRGGQRLGRELRRDSAAWSASGAAHPKFRRGQLRSHRPVARRPPCHDRRSHSGRGAGRCCSHLCDQAGGTARPTPLSTPATGEPSGWRFFPVAAPVATPRTAGSASCIDAHSRVPVHPQMPASQTVGRQGVVGSNPASSTPGQRPCPGSGQGLCVTN